MLREVARVLADDFGKRVVVVDTSNEIAGDGDIPHPAIGDARRMQVRTPARPAQRHDRGGREPHARGDRHRRDRDRARGPGRTHHRRARRAAGGHGPRQHARQPDAEPDPLRPGRRALPRSPWATRRRAGAAPRRRCWSARLHPPSTSWWRSSSGTASSSTATWRRRWTPSCAATWFRPRRAGGTTRARCMPPTKYDYRISETEAGNPAFAPLEPLGGYGAFSGRGRAGGGYGGGTGLRPLPGRGDARPGRSEGRGGRGLRPLPGERLADPTRPRGRLPGRGASAGPTRWGRRGRIDRRPATIGP